MKKELWVRLKGYRFQNLVPVSLADRVKGMFGETDAFTRAFAAKVAKKHGWTEEFAFLAVREYKKFVFLGVVSKYEVTPSKVIDIVWHEHQLFTKGYREFCRNVLKKYFDHSPELIPFDSQTEAFNVQYQKTLAFYEHEFGTVPPYQIWGKTKFDPSGVKGLVKKPKQKETYSSSKASSESDTPLYTMFSSEPDAPYAPIPVSFSGQGGSFDGGGASGGWNDSAPSTHSAPSAPSVSTSSCSSSTSSCSSSSSSCGGGGGGCGSS